MIVEKYWSSKAPEEQLERFKVGSKDYKNLKAKLDAEEEEDVAAQVKKPKTKSKSVSPSKKRTSSSRGADAELSEKPKANKRSKKAQVEEAEEEVEQDDEEASEAGFDAAGKLSVEWKEVADSTEPNSWEVSISPDSPSRVLCSELIGRRLCVPGPRREDRHLRERCPREGRCPPDVGHLEEADSRGRLVRVLGRVDGHSPNLPSKVSRFLRGKLRHFVCTSFAPSRLCPRRPPLSLLFYRPTGFIYRSLVQ